MSRAGPLVLLRRSLLCASSIATLLLFPLLNGLSSLPIWLHWTSLDSAETLCAWLLAIGAIGLTLWLPALRGLGLLRDAVGACWILAGAMFFFAAVVKVGAVARYAAAYRSHSLLAVGVATVLLWALATAAVLKPGTGAISRVERAMMLMWPLSALLMLHLLRAPGLTDRQEGYEATGAASAPTRTTTTATRPLRTVVLLFDEMSVDYLFGDRTIDLSSMPALQRLRQSSEIHLDVHLHGGATAVAIPALFVPTADAPDGLINALKVRRRSIRVWGWYHDYCRTFTRGVDACHSTSIYNVRTLHNGFSPLDPWWTDLNLLPAERPFDALKVPAAVTFHRETLEAASRWLQAQLADPTGDFVYAHLNVPHMPLLSPSARPFSMDEASYLTQFAYVDRVVAIAFADRTRPSQIIILSDHNARPLFPVALHDHVVYARYREGVPGLVVDKREDAAQLLSRMSVHDAEERAQPAAP